MTTISRNVADPVKRSGQLALAAAAMTVGLIAYGAWVRASGSGLGCPDWPLCEGSLVPALEGDTAIEFGHRFYAGLTMLTVGAASWYAYLGRRIDPLMARIVIAALVTIIFQAALGGATVLTELDGMVRLAHLGTAMFTLALLTAGAMRGLDVRGSAYPGFRTATVLVTLAAVVVLMGGSIVGASLSGACPGIPLCDDRSPTDAAWVHGVHRTVAVLFLLVLVATSALIKRRGGSRLATGLAHAATLLVVVQIGVGVSAVTQSLPASLRVLHLGIAALIWWSVVAQWVLALKARSS